MPYLPPEPPRRDGTIFAVDPGYPGRRLQVRTIDGMHSVKEATALTGVDGLTIRYWVGAFGLAVGTRFARGGRLFVHVHVIRTIAALRDGRGWLPRFAWRKGSERHRLVMLAILAAVKAHDVAPPETIARVRIKLGLPAYPKLRISPAVRIAPERRAAP